MNQAVISFFKLKYIFFVFALTIGDSFGDSSLTQNVALFFTTVAKKEIFPSPDNLSGAIHFNMMLFRPSALLCVTAPYLNNRTKNLLIREHLHFGTKAIDLR